MQYIDGVVYVPVDEEPGDGEDSGSCCTRCDSDEKAFTYIPPDGVAAIAVQAQTNENLVDESRLRRSRFALLDYPEYLDVPYANPVVQTVEVQQVQTIERIVEVLQIQCREVIRHVTVPQVQEVMRQVTVLSRRCLRLTRDPTEYEFVASDTRHGRNPSTTLPGTAFHRPITQTHASRSTTKDC